MKVSTRKSCRILYTVTLQCHGLTKRLWVQLINCTRNIKWQTLEVEVSTRQGTRDSDPRGLGASPTVSTERDPQKKGLDTIRFRGSEII